MSLDSNLSSQVETGMPIVLPPHLVRIFETADAQIRDTYSLSPGVATLIRLWLAISTPSQVRREFELAVLDIRKSGSPLPTPDFDEEPL